MEDTTANITNRLKIMAAGVALAASGFVLGATGAAWADSDKTGEAGACNNHAAVGHEM